MVRKAERVETYMTPRVPTVDENSTLEFAKGLIEDYGFDYLIVTRKGEPTHILNEMILYKHPKEKKIKDILSELEPAATVKIGTDLRKVQSMLSEKPALLVIDENGKMMGSLSARELWEKK